MQEIHSVSIGFITAASGRSSGGRRDERKVPSHPQVSQARPPPSCIQPLPRMKSFQLFSIEEAGDLSAYDCVFLGFWIEGGTACEETANVLRHLTNRHIFLFATLAADPESAHAIASMQNAKNLLPSDSFPKGTFLCRGAVSKETVRKMFEKYPFGNTETRILSECCLLSGSARHPNDEDLAKVETFARVMYQHLKDQ